MTSPIHAQAWLNPVVLVGFVAVVSIVIFLFSVQVAEALVASPQTSCHSIASGGSVPQGYGAPYNVFSSTRTLLIQSVGCTPSKIDIVVGDDMQTTYIYRISYYWNGSSWIQAPLTSLSGQGDWFVGGAETSIPVIGTSMWYVAYTCQHTDGQWRCGCANTSCAQSLWQLQLFVFP